MKTLGDLLANLRGFEPETKLVFIIDEGEIGTGFHITELRHSFSRGIDCSGHFESWQESRLQILEGAGSAHMRVDTFCGILKKGLDALPELRDAPVLIEVGLGNKNLTLMRPGPIELGEDRVLMRLENTRAVCRPMEKARAASAISITRPPGQMMKPRRPRCCL